MPEVQTKVDYVKPIGRNSTFKAGYQGKIFISPEDYLMFHNNNKIVNFQASYSRRVKRPQQWQLWPEMTYVDPTTVWQGNPLLDVNEGGF